MSEIDRLSGYGLNRHAGIVELGDTETETPSWLLGVEDYAYQRTLKFGGNNVYYRYFLHKRINEYYWDAKN
ncbi:MAG: hypothetical protein AAFO91_12105 [Bacteroidota bacterium]